MRLTSHLNSEINTLGYPKAALFGFCVAMVAYTIHAVLKAALSSVNSVEKIENEVSGYYIADEISNVYGGMMIAIPHSIVGPVEIFVDLLTGEAHQPGEAFRFPAIAIVGNLMGGSVFVAALNYTQIRCTQSNDPSGPVQRSTGSDPKNEP
ncbi:MAG: hypothetical protein JXR76_19830 [Deltaproteobacteria bacterium]|nr:hypothetical protein [Deltaproteobacteria bacterium]